MSSNELVRTAKSAEAQKFQFSLRMLLAISFVTSCWLGILRLAPHVAIFLSGVALVVVAVLLVIRLRRKQTSRLAGAAVLVFAGIAIFYFYLLSIGPVVAMTENALGNNRAAIKFFYAPVFWIHHETPLAEPIERYAALWGWH
ncbi:MAG: hypothetical protein AAF802_01685 [Planctomycetota bacterium]